jgi:hypothetical protein
VRSAQTRRGGEALEQYERKKNLAMAAQVRERLLALHGEPVAR